MGIAPNISGILQAQAGGAGGGSGPPPPTVTSITPNSCSESINPTIPVTVKGTGFDPTHRFIFIKGVMMGTGLVDSTTLTAGGVDPTPLGVGSWEVQVGDIGGNITSGPTGVMFTVNP